MTTQPEAVQHLWQPGDLVRPVSSSGDWLTTDPVAVARLEEKDGQPFYILVGTNTGYPESELEPGGLLEWALWYAGVMGWAIHPLRRRDKNPILEKWGLQATTDPKQIRAWWAGGYKTRNIGLACKPSGLVVVDLDVKNGIDGMGTWANIRANLGFADDTLTSQTPSGGKHLFFRANGAAIGSPQGVAPGIDIKADGADNGGYVLLPPSVLADGKTYTWLKSPLEHKPAEIPQVLVDLLTGKAGTSKVTTSKATTSKAGTGSTPDPDPWDAASSLGAGHDSYAEKALQYELGIVVQAQEGTRNDTLNKAAFSLGQLVGDGRLDRGRVEVELTKAAYACGLHVDPNCGPRGIAGSIKSGLDKGEQDPRSLRGLPGASLPGTAPDPKPADQEPRLFNRTDQGNAERLVARHGAALRFCDPWRTWFVWDGQRWKKDDTLEIQGRAKDTARNIHAEAVLGKDKKERDAIAAWASKSEDARRIDAMIKMARNEVPVTPESLETDPWLLTVNNGTLDLRTGKLLPHDPGHLITKLAPVDYDPEAQAPTWAAFLDRIMAGNQDLIGFLQRAVGYALTGDTREHSFFVLYGVGANGKTTFLETLSAMLGDYAAATPTQTLLARRGDAMSNDVARLRGARFVSAVEAEEGQRLAESLVKQMTGGDTLTVRKMYSDFFEFKPTFKLFLASNHKPIIRGNDLGIWRRIKLTPFGVVIPDPEQDKDLPRKLQAELPGILAWAVRGCLEWQRAGLGVPQEVVQATAQYQSEMDHLAGFLEDMCILKPAARAETDKIWEAYISWASANGETPLTKRQFNRKLTERGLEQRKSGAARFWQGLGLVVDPSDFAPSSGAATGSGAVEESDLAYELFSF